MAKRKTPKMEKVTTIETTELDTIQDLVSKTNQGNLEIGRLETQKHKVMHMMEENIKTGEISPLEVETTI